MPDRARARILSAMRSEVWFPAGATQRDWMIDAGSTLVLALLGALFTPVLLGYIEPSSRLLAGMTFLPLVVRRHSPLLAMIGCGMGCLLQLMTLPGPTGSVVVVPILAYVVARWVPGLPARSVVVLGLVGAVLGPVKWVATSWLPVYNGLLLIAFFLMCAAAVLTPYAAGRRVRETAIAREAQLAAAEERYARRAYAHEQQTRIDEAAQRATIARELHDIVAHSLSVMIVQAEGGKALARKKPEVAEQALTTIAETGRESLYEMRRIVGVLRGGPDARADFAPAPSLRDIPDLVTRASEHARLEVYGEPVGTSPALEVTVYRIVQEGLTNFLKHAGAGAEASVILTYSPSQVSVEVVDTGHGVPDPTEGGGNGIRGMQERVTSMGGTITAGPRDDGPGFRVYARIPVRTPYERLAEPPETGDPR